MGAEEDGNNEKEKPKFNFEWKLSFLVCFGQMDTKCNFVQRESEKKPHQIYPNLQRKIKFDKKTKKNHHFLILFSEKRHFDRG